MLKRCPRCNGLRKIAAIGGIKKDCPNCKAIGFVEDKPVTIDSIDVEVPSAKEEKRASRKGSQGKEKTTSP
jgi:phage FluMu protein Com